jgi:hypothetical protein
LFLRKIFEQVAIFSPLPWFVSIKIKCPVRVSTHREQYDWSVETSTKASDTAKKFNLDIDERLK